MNPRNAAMLRKGYAPAADVAAAMGRNLSTIHRWVNAEEVAFEREGRWLYIDVASVEKSPHVGNNAILKAELKKLRERIRDEAKAAGQPD